jgi:hypothetical protein
MFDIVYSIYNKILLNIVSIGKILLQPTTIQIYSKYNFYKRHQIRFYFPAISQLTYALCSFACKPSSNRIFVLRYE